MNGNEFELLRNRLRIIGLTLLVLAPAVFLVLVWTVFQDPIQEKFGTGDDSMVWLLTGFALVDTIAGIFLRRLLLRVDTVVSRCGNDACNVKQAIFAVHVVGFAILLSPALIGLALQLATHSSMLATLLICLSPLAYVFCRPTEASVDDLAREVSARLSR